MRILVTGGAGYLGSVLCERLLNRLRSPSQLVIFPTTTNSDYGVKRF